MSNTISFNNINTKRYQRNKLVLSSNYFIIQSRTLYDLIFTPIIKLFYPEIFFPGRVFCDTISITESEIVTQYVTICILAKLN